MGGGEVSQIEYPHPHPLFLQVLILKSFKFNDFVSAYSTGFRFAAVQVFILPDLPDRRTLGEPWVSLGMRRRRLASAWRSMRATPCSRTGGATPRFSTGASRLAARAKRLERRTCPGWRPGSKDKVYYLTNQYKYSVLLYGILRDAVENEEIKDRAGAGAVPRPLPGLRFLAAHY